MSENKLKDLMSVEIQQKERSNFDRSRVVRTSMSPGFIYPILVEETLPNSITKIDVKQLLKTNPTLAPIMGQFKLRFETFFVPTRLYLPELDMNKLNTAFSNDVKEPVIPIKVYTADATVEEGVYVPSGSLMEYLGFPPGFSNRLITSPSDVQTLMFNGVPLCGYFDIYRNYYANPQDTKIPVYQIGLADPAGLNFLPCTFDLDYLDNFVNSVYNRVYNYNGHSDVLQTLGDVECKPLPGIPIEPFSFNPFAPATGNISGSFSHLGLLLRTYSNDYFTSRLDNSYIDYQESVAKVNVSNNSFTINSLRMMNRVAKFVDRSLLAGTRYGDWLKVHFGASADNKLCIPQFLGSDTVYLNFDDVVAQSASDAQTPNDSNTLGQRAGTGQLFGSGKPIEFYAPENGYIMVMASIVPEVDYYQGFPKWTHKTKLSDHYTPEFDAVGYQDLLFSELVGCGTYDGDGLSIPITLDQFNSSVGKQPAWFEYMTATNELHGDFTNTLRYWTLARQFAIVTPQSTLSLDFSTYVNPALFNYAFSVTSPTYDNFFLQASFTVLKKEVMSKQILPSL